MSTLQTQNVVSNVVTANIVTTGTGTFTINSTGLSVTNSVYISPSQISVGGSVTNNILQPVISEPSITIGGSVITTLNVASEVCNIQIFTSNGNWTKPSWAAAVGAANTSADLIMVHVWGAGGGGNVTTSPGTGGGGGAFVYGIYMSTQVNSTANVTVGIGGGAGIAGGSSKFGNSLSFDGVDRSLTAYGGGTGNSTYGGGGGGWTSAGSLTSGGDPLGGNTTGADSTFGGGGSRINTSGAGGDSIYGGGGGGNTGGFSIYGGGGGGSRNGLTGNSIYGGWGGNGSVRATVPGGGGAGNTYPTGANGKVIVYTIRKLA